MDRYSKHMAQFVSLFIVLTTGGLRWQVGLGFARNRSLQMMESRNSKRSFGQESADKPAGSVSQEAKAGIRSRQAIGRVGLRTVELDVHILSLLASLG